jgi:hypothetical protein
MILENSIYSEIAIVLWATDGRILLIEGVIPIGNSRTSSVF